MPSTVWAVVQDGKIELLEDLHLQEGSKVLVTLLNSEEEVKEFWAQVSQPSLLGVWDNPQDDVYAELLQT
jgi:hypothetical protein